MPAFYIVLQEKIPGADGIGLEGRALSKYNAKLEELAQHLGVRSLMSFFSTDEREVRELLGDEGAEKLGSAIPNEEWFSAELGLTTISALLNALAMEPSPENSKLIKELNRFQRALEAAQLKKIRWHLAIDI